MKIDCKPGLVATTMGVTWQSDYMRDGYSREFDAMVAGGPLVTNVQVILIDERTWWDCECGSRGQELIAYRQTSVVEGTESANFGQFLHFTKNGRYWDPAPKLVSYWQAWKDTKIAQSLRINPTAWDEHFFDDLYELFHS